MPLVFDEDQPKKSLVFDDEESSVPWSQVPKNALTDIETGIKRIADPLGLAESAKDLSQGKSLGETATAEKLGGELQQWKDPLGVLKGLGKGMIDPIIHPIESFKKSPVNTAVGAAMMTGKLPTGKVPAKPAPIAEAIAPESIVPEAPLSPEPLNISSEAAQILKGATEKPSPIETVNRIAAEAPRPLDLAAEAGEILRKPIEKPVPPPDPIPVPKGPFDATKSFLSKATESIKDPATEVRNYLIDRYKGLAQKQDFSKTLPAYLREYSRNMALKDVGMSPMQFKKLGFEKADALGQYIRDNKISDPLRGSIGQRAIVDSINSKAGEIIGNIRKIADQRAQGPAYELSTIESLIKQKLDPIYTKGIKAGEKGSYMKALAELKRTKLTHEGLAQLATKLNKAAADETALKQPSGAITDVANIISDINNQSVSKYLKPDEIMAYDKALDDFGATKKIQQFLLRKGSREVTGRLGPRGIVNEVIQGGMDTIGYKSLGKIADKMADFIERNPQKATDATGLFKQFINEVQDLGVELTDIVD